MYAVRQDANSTAGRVGMEADSYQVVLNNQMCGNTHSGEDA